MQLTKEQVEEMLLAYAWAGDAESQKREVECIMAQNEWELIEVQADKYAGAQFEWHPGLMDEATGWAVSALYECHDGPHLKTCPNWKPKEA